MENHRLAARDSRDSLGPNREGRGRNEVAASRGGRGKGRQPSRPSPSKRKVFVWKKAEGSISLYPPGGSELSQSHAVIAGTPMTQNVTPAFSSCRRKKPEGAG